MLIILEVELLVSYLEAMKTALVIVITSKTKFELTFADAESKGKENELVLYREYQRSTRIHMRSPSTLYPGFYGVAAGAEIRTCEPGWSHVGLVKCFNFLENMSVYFLLIPLNSMSINVCRTLIVEFFSLFVFDPQTIRAFDPGPITCFSSWWMWFSEEIVKLRLHSGLHTCD